MFFSNSYVNNIIEKKFRQIPRSGTHYLCHSILQEGIGSFLDWVQVCSKHFVADLRRRQRAAKEEVDPLDESARMEAAVVHDEDHCRQQEALLLAEAKSFLGRSRYMNEILELLLQYYTRCLGKLSNDVGDFTCVKDLVKAWAQMDSRDLIFDDEEMFGAMFAKSGAFDEKVTVVDRHTFISVLYRNMEHIPTDMSYAPKYRAVLEKAIEMPRRLHL